MLAEEEVCITSLRDQHDGKEGNDCSVACAI